MIKCLLLLTCIFGIGCSGMPVSYSSKIDKERQKKISEFLSETNLSIERNSPFYLHNNLTSQKIYAALKVQKVEAKYDVKIELMQCSLKKGFWQNSLSILSIATVTLVPFTSEYNCPIAVTVKTLASERKMSYQADWLYAESYGISALYSMLASSLVVQQEQRDIIYHLLERASPK